jgi:hypothetical protein
MDHGGVMTEQEILDLIMNCGTTPYEGDVDTLLLAYVRQLAHLSDQLDKSDFIELMAIGVGIYEIALKEFQAGTDA